MSAPAQAVSRHSSPQGRLATWARQGIESFVAAQNILLDLTAQQNALVIGVLRERINFSQFSPDALVKMADQGVSNLTSAGQILLDLAAGESAVVIDGLKEGFRLPVAAGAAADVLRDRITTFIEMQKRLLDATAEQAHTVAESYEQGEGLHATENMAALARKGLEGFVETEKKFLDLASSEVSAAVEASKSGRKPAPRDRAKVLTDVARESVDKFVDAQKKLVDLAIKQIEATSKAAKKAEAEEEPKTSFAEATEKGVRNFVKAQKSLLDLAIRPAKEEQEEAEAPRRTTRPRRKK